MLDFKGIEAEDCDKIKPYLEKFNSLLCDYSVVILYLWRHTFNSEYCIVDDFLIIKNTIEDEVYFYFPISKNEEKVVSYDVVFKKLSSYCQQNKIVLRFFCLDDNMCQIVNKFFPTMTFTYERDWSDYLYDYEQIKNFSGKKLAMPRNHLNHFLKNYDYQILDISNSNLDLVKLAVEKYYMRNDLNSKEKKALDYLLDHYDMFNVVGKILIVDDEVVAFTIAKIIKDVLFVHIEKADKEYKGSYQMIFYELMKDLDVKYVNREEDLGIEGLRKSKLSYRPLALLNKYYTALKEQL